MPAQRQGRRLVAFPTRWALAAGVLVAAGLSVWIVADQFGQPSGRAIVQTVNGTLYEVSPNGMRPISAGQPLPDGVELRTAKDSDAMLKMRDGPTVELRERSGVSNTKSGREPPIRLRRGTIII